MSQALGLAYWVLLPELNYTAKFSETAKSQVLHKMVPCK
jgi:hypothetical protein